MIRSYAEGITASCLRRICRLFLVSDIFVCLLVHAAYGASAGVVHSGESLVPRKSFSRAACNARYAWYAQCRAVTGEMGGEE